jgi:hypothetical protein
VGTLAETLQDRVKKMLQVREEDGGLWDLGNRAWVWWRGESTNHSE